MQRISAVNPATATGKAKQLLDGVQAKLGMTPNMMKTMAAAPSVLEGYLNLNASLAGGVLDAKFREQIALTVAQANSCEYCLSAHSAIGKRVGLTADDIRSSREAHAADAKRNAGLRFARALVIERAHVSDQTVADVKAAGYTEGEIAEIVANVALNIFTNYFNNTARTEVDFPKVSIELAEPVHA
ncbi:MAG: carboxymuconolactone decarboxylase family protein [Bryobacteraceae bacterium]